MHRTLGAAAFTIAAMISTSAFAGDSSRLAETSAPGAHEQRVEAMLSASGLKVMIMSKLQTDQQSLEAAARREIGGVQISDPAGTDFSAARERYLSAITELKKQLDWQVVREPIVSYYGKSFTDEELDAVTKFFASDAGAAFRDRQAGLIAGTDVIIQAREKEMVPAFRAVTKTFQTSAQKLPQGQADVDGAATKAAGPSSP